METRLQKYNGRNVYNNRVFVNFKDKKVDFVPIKETHVGFYRRYYVFFMSMFTRLMLITMFISLVVFFPYLMFYEEEALALLPMILTLVIPFGIAFPFSLLYFDKKWRENKFPEFNYKMLGTLKTVFKMESAVRKKTVKPDAIVNNQFVIRQFSNVSLRYKVFDDFANYLKSIEINNIFDKKDTDWYAIFTFNKQPKHGYMSLYYI